MNIGVYIEHGDGTGVGGAEVMMAGLAAAWSHDHDVDLIHHRPPLTRERVTSFSDDDYSRVRFRYVAREPDALTHSHPIKRLRAAREWHRAVSDGYDLFVNCTHWLPCFNHATTGALLVLFPFYVRPTETAEIARLPTWKRLRHRLYYDHEWRRRLATYQHRLAISRFTHEWTRRRWNLDTTVVYPPVDVDFASRSKEPLILSVGRFATLAHTKKQLELMDAFASLHASGLGAWSYASIGGLNTRPENQEYFERVRRLGERCSATVEANVTRGRARSLFERASIYWHATGLDEDTDRHPELCEHFGISTVEAMAAGCVPVVIDKGGQSEIVSHGRNGFVWRTLDELRRYTRQLIADDALRETMATAARERAQTFARAHFLARMSAVCQVSLQSVPAAASPRAVVTES